MLLFSTVQCLFDAAHYAYELVGFISFMQFYQDNSNKMWKDLDKVDSFRTKTAIAEG